MPMMLDDHMGPLGAAMPNMDDDLFGDEVLPMATRPPSKQLQQRVDEMRSRGCCRGISCSKLGTIASISPDGTHINLQCARASPSDASWELSEPTSCSIFSQTLPGGPIVHLAWSPAITPELAVIDAYGRVCLLFFNNSVNKASLITRKWDNDTPDDLLSVVGCYWLPLLIPPNRQFNVTYGPAVRENGKYQYNNSIIQASGPYHPNPSRSALVCVTANGLLKLFFAQNSNLVQETQLEMESITSSDDLITHAAVCSDRGKLVVVLATAARQLKVVHAEVNWGTSQPQDKQVPPGSMPLKPSLKAEHVTGTSWLQQGLVESHLDAAMDQISLLEVYPPVVDVKTKTSLPATVLTIRSHVPSAQTPYNVEYQSIIDRWDILTDQPQQLHPAFEQRGSKTGSAPTLHPMTRLRKRESIVINKVVVSIETTQLGRVICIGFSDGTIQFRDRSTMAELANEDHHNHIMVPQQAGFHFDDEKPCVQLAMSPNNCSFTQVSENGKLKWNSLKYPADQIGSTRQDPLYDAALTGLTLAAANAVHQNSNYDDVLAVARPFVEKHPRFLHEMVSMMVFMLNINVDYSEESHYDPLIRNLQIHNILGLLNHLGFRGEFKSRSFTSKFAMLALNIRHIVILITLASNSSMNPAKEKWTPLDEPEVVDALTGCAKWALDLLCWLTDSLFVLRDDPKFMELLNPGRFSEMTPYLKSKNDVSLHLLLCSSTRGFLVAACKRLNHLQVMSTQATQFWDKNPAMHTTDSKANQGLIAIQQAYLKMQKCITTTLITVKEIDRILSVLGGDIKQQYQASLAMLAQKQQQQSGKPNQPPADAAVKKAQAHCELNMLLAETPPPSFLQVIKKFFETDLKNLAATTDRSGLFFTDFPLLEVEEDPRRLAARKAQGKYVDTFKRVELTAHVLSKTSDGERMHRPHEQQQQQVDADAATSLPWRRCVRCCSVMEDAPVTKSGMNFVLSQMRRSPTMRLTTTLLAIAATATADGHIIRRQQRPGSGPTPRADTSNLPITREGSTLLLDGEPWKAVGPNVYWLGLDENVIPPAGEPFYSPSNASYPTKGRVTEVMAIVRALGGTAIRAHTVGVSTGNPLSVWPEQGMVNEQAFESIDWAIAQARSYGLRLMVPLTDNYDYYHGGKYNFLRWAGFNLTQAADANNPLIQQFYTNETIVDTFKEYIHTLLTHVNQYTNLTYAEDPTIFAIESGNELAGPVWGDMDVPAAWVEEIAGYVKSLAPAKLFVDGTYGVNQTHLRVEDVDIFSDHFYPVSIAKLQQGLDLVASVNKSYFAGEYDWVGSADDGATPRGDSLADWFGVIEQSPVAVGDAFWSLFGHNVPDCTVFVNHTDGFTLQYGNPANSDYTDSRIQLIHQHSVRLSQGQNISADADLPVVPCPASPDGESRRLKW